MPATLTMPIPEEADEDAAGGGDASLARRAVAGDADAFGELIERHERAALAVAYAVTRRGAKAADAVQEACLKAWQKRQSLAEPEKFAAWLLNIVRRCAVDQLRRGGRNFEPLSVDPAAEGATSDPLERREQEDEVRRAMDELDEETRLAVSMRFYDASSSKDIAAVLGCSPAAVDMRLKRGRDKLRELLHDYADEFRPS